MNIFLSKVKQLVENLAKENKPFNFFSLVKLIDAEFPEWDRGFDVVVSAEWFPKRKYSAIGLMVNYLYEILDIDERKNLGNVIILDKDEDFIKEALKVAQNNIEINDRIIKGLSVKEAIILAPKQYRELRTSQSFAITEEKNSLYELTI